MKKHWQAWSARIDALTLRERLIIFAMAALGAVVLMNVLVLDPLTAEQDRISKRMKDEQAQIARLRAEIQQRVNEGTADPDAGNRVRLSALQDQADDLRRTVAGVQRGLISPDRMVPLLEDILRSSTRLRLLSLKKLPVTSLVDAASVPPASEVAEQDIAGLYRHGVELSVQGSYLDMLAYLSELEQLSPQLSWGDVSFSVDQHPNATMTLTVYTLSLDRKWLHI